MYFNEDIESLSTCINPLTSIYHRKNGSQGLLEAALQPIPDGWAYIDRTDKEGWQWESAWSQSRLPTDTRHLAVVSNVINKRSGGSAGLTARSIGFWVDFGLHPSLVYLVLAKL